MKGVVIRLVGDKGFGFIRAEGGNGGEFFFHRSACSERGAFESLREGQRVVFKEGEGPKGPRAEDVRAME